MKREVKGLRWARALLAKPEGIPQGRPRGVKALGVRYEKALERELSGAKRGVWFEFEDWRGHGICQVDFLLPWLGRIVVLEAKYTWTEEAHWELERLYLPVVAMALEVSPRGIVVVKKLVPGMKARVSDNVAEAVNWAEGARSALHWIGNGPLLLRPPFFAHRPSCDLAESRIV